MGKVESDLWGEHSPSNKTHNTDDCGVMALRNNEVTWEDHSCTAPEVSHHPVAPVCQTDTEDSAPTTTTTTTPPLHLSPARRDGLPSMEAATNYFDHSKLGSLQ